MTQAKRIAAKGVRHRRPNGPQALEVSAIEPPNPREIGTLHLYTEEAIRGGPRALIAAEREAHRLSAKYGEEINPQYCLATPFILRLANGDVDPNQAASHDANESKFLLANASHDAIPADKKHLGQSQDVRAIRARMRERAKYAMMWRPRFLAVLSLTRSTMMAARAAKVSRVTVRSHRRQDPDFDFQCKEAKQSAIEHLEDMTMRSAIEGELKPIYWQGILVGHEPQYDNRLRIEMLRAHKPDTYKTPGSKVNVNTGNQLVIGEGTIVDPATLGKLMEMRQESLKRLRASKLGTLVADPVPSEG